MNNSLDPDFEEFKFSDENKIWKDDALDDIQTFGMFFPKILNALCIYGKQRIHTYIHICLISHTFYLKNTS